MRSAGRLPFHLNKLMPTSAKPQDLQCLMPSDSRDKRSPRILVADDQQHILEALQLLLHPHGYRVDLVKSPAQVRDALTRDFYDAALIDLELHARHHLRPGRPRSSLRNRERSTAIFLS